nr:transcription factor bHLH117 [Tanacetum cinerariifolium]
MDFHFQSLLTGKYPITTPLHHHHPSPATSDESSTTPPPPPQKPPYHLLKKPKLEHPENTSYLNNINPYHHPMIMFHQLPDLTSFENLPPIPSNHYYPPLLPSFQPQPRKKTSTARAKALQNRRTLSEKTRSLQKVLPLDKKMDMGTLLEETYKYIKFLQAQVKVLELMPVDSSTTGSNFGTNNEDDNVTVAYGSYGSGTYGYGYYGGYGDVYGGLRRLNRQQLLEVIVNSPAAQEVLYKRGCCVYSTEQLVMIKDLAEKNYASMYY